MRAEGRLAPGARYIVDGVARDLLDVEPEALPFDLLRSSYDNAGNTIHAEAPFAFWDDGANSLIDGRRWRSRNGKTFAQTIEFANASADAFLFSAANFIQFDGMSIERRSAYRELSYQLQRLEIPLVPLGLGVQAPRRWNPRDNQLPAEAIELIQVIGSKSTIISARGEFSASVMRDYAGVSNVMVTGCPSFFSNPSAFNELRSFLAGPRPGIASFNMTNPRKDAELELLRRAVSEKHLLVDVQRGLLSRFRGELLMNPELADVPDVLREAIRRSHGEVSDREVREFGQSRIVSFSRAGDWIDMLRRVVRFSWGTRLHANMAALLAGRPALWVAHDTRTIEATNTLHLPAVTLSEALGMSSSELEDAVDFSPMFDSLSDLFLRFNEFLEASELPAIRLRF